MGVLQDNLQHVPKRETPWFLAFVALTESPKFGVQGLGFGTFTAWSSRRDSISNYVGPTKLMKIVSKGPSAVPAQIHKP